MFNVIDIPETVESNSSARLFAAEPPLRTRPEGSKGEANLEGNDGTSSAVWWWLAAALDELDYGILLLSHDGHTSYVNHAARVALDDSHPLQLFGATLRARLPSDVASLRTAVQDASARGLRRLLTFGERTRQVCISVVPVALPASAARAVLLVLGRNAVCEPLSMGAFARAHALTGAETRVLVALCSGAEPADIAARLGVAITTVRSQIGSVRAKTGSASIRALVRQIAALPPLKGVLRETSCSILAPNFADLQDS